MDKGFKMTKEQSEGFEEAARIYSACSNIKNGLLIPLGKEDERTFFR